MSPSSPSSAPSSAEESRAILARFIESDELERLEAWSDRFNIFEALGAVRSELRHSNMLAWLLDPTESHKLGPAFLALFLRHVSHLAREDETVLSDSVPSPFNIDGWDLSHVEVRREWRNIDLLLVDAHNGFIGVIENKVFSSEHSNQLARYQQLADAAFPAAEYQICALLSPGGTPPSDSNYVALSYDDVSTLLHRLLDRRGHAIGPEVLTLITHYQATIDRHMSTDPEIKQICREIYRAHRHALDIIFDNLPDLYAETHEQLVDIIKDDPELILDHSNKTYTRFIPAVLDPLVPRDSSGPFNEGRVVFFEFENRPGRPLHLKLEMTPCPEALRRPILDYALKHKSLFPNTSTKDKGGWKKLWGRNLPASARDTDPENRREALVEEIEQFKRTRLPQFVAAFEEIQDKPK